MSRPDEVKKGAAQPTLAAGAAVAVGAEARDAALSDRDRLCELMKGYQNADRAAATELVERLSPVLLRFLSRPLHTRAYAEDMLQDCWLRIHKARHSHRPGTPVLPWIFAIARHTRIDAYRRRHRIDTREYVLDESSEGFEPSPTQPNTPDFDLWRAVRALPDKQQEVIRMLKISGMSLEEVAGATGTTVGAVKQRAHRAYTKLRQVLGDSYRSKRSSG